MIDPVDLKNIDISEYAQVPDSEPGRQYYFMKKDRELVHCLENTYGRRLSYHVETFGCQMNFKDSEKLEGVLATAGFISEESEKADIVIYNTCTVRENANTKVYGRIGYLGKLKKSNPDMIIVMCGCMMQEPSEVEKIRKSYHFVDLIFGTHNIFKLAELLEPVLSARVAQHSASADTLKKQKHRIEVDVWNDTDLIVEDLPSILKYRFKAGVNIMFGCNNFCTYCIVPYVRGRERSRRSEDILNEIRDMADHGIVEVMLLGQNVNSYGKCRRSAISENGSGAIAGEREISFAQLLQKTEEIEGIKRIRFMTSHPKDLSDELIDVMAGGRHICRHIHLPLQSGSDRILKKMNRHYSSADYLRLVEKLRTKMPDIAITTDIIVGFPGETEEDFEDTLDICRSVEFDSAFTFIYSKREGTPAAAFEDQVPEDIIKDRFDRLLEVIKESSEKKAYALTGQTVEVLAEEKDKEGDGRYLTGRLENNLLVHFEGTEDLIGKLVNVKLEECKGFYFTGIIV